MGKDYTGSNLQVGMAPGARLRIFINYRHEDTWAEALLLYERLADRFGCENVFLDQRNVQPGMKWLREIISHGAACNVFLSLIGSRWMSSMKTREQAGVAQPAEDYVRFEIEFALQRDTIVVIPVLVGDVGLPFGQRLPRSLQPLTKIEWAQVRRKRFEEDVAFLVDRLEAIGREGPARPQQKNQVHEETRTGEIHTKSVAPRPDAAHYELVLQHMVHEGNLVPWLGSRLKGNRRAKRHEGSGSLPDAGELAAHLATRFGVKSTPLDLAEVAQYVYMTKGRPDLYRTLRQILTAPSEPGPVHRFLARLPKTLEQQGLEKRHQLIISTKFDTALEQAFDDEHEPYDLVVYMASGRDKGKFVHFPFDADPEPITIPNAYGKLPIGDYGELERTVIMKIHGAVDGAIGDYRWKENYVITEDHYIDYLSRSPIESLLPVQILDKLRDSHCLFLGYTMRDWNLRVFLKRVWMGEPLGAKSWAVEPDTDVLEKEFWAQSYVDLYTAELADYTDQLSKRLSAPA